jgi:hypothetical protein
MWVLNSTRCVSAEQTEVSSHDSINREYQRSANGLNRSPKTVEADAVRKLLDVAQLHQRCGHFGPGMLKTILNPLDFLLSVTDLMEDFFRDGEQPPMNMAA